MMTNARIFTDLWIARSPAWWLALAAVDAYILLGRRRRPSMRQVAYFAVAVTAFVIALASPLATLATRYLFSAHMAQHLLLLLIVPLFATLAWPLAKKRGLPHTSTSRQLTGANTLLGWVAGVGAMWFWHIPAMCTASMHSPHVFAIQVVSLIAAGALFWRPVFGPNAEHRIPPHTAAAYLFAGCIGCSLLGIYVTFVPVSVCPLYAAPPPGSYELVSFIHEQWGMTHRIDQQIGGLLMWVPACTVYLSAILFTLKSWYQIPELARAAR